MKRLLLSLPFHTLFTPHYIHNNFHQITRDPFYGILYKPTVTCENMPSGLCVQRKPRSACASTQSDQGIRCPFTESLDTINNVAKHQMSRPDRADVQADLVIRCPHATGRRMIT